MNRIHPRIQDWQHTQKVGKDCTNLTFTIMSPSQVELTMVMEVEHLERNFQSLYTTNVERNLHA